MEGGVLDRPLTTMFACDETADWINQDWMEDHYDPNPVLLCRFSDGKVVCAYQSVCAMLPEDDLPNYCPYEWLRNQMQYNTLLNGMKLDEHREYAFDIDGLVDAILMEALRREKGVFEDWFTDQDA